MHCNPKRSASDEHPSQPSPVLPPHQSSPFEGWPDRWCGVCGPAPVRHPQFPLFPFSLFLSFGTVFSAAGWNFQKARPPARQPASWAPGPCYPPQEKGIDKGRTLTQETQHLTPHQAPGGPALFATTFDIVGPPPFWTPRLPGCQAPKGEPSVLGARSSQHFTIPYKYSSSLFSLILSHRYTVKGTPGYFGPAWQIPSETR